MFHDIHKWLTVSLLNVISLGVFSANAQEFRFKPASTSLTEVFTQMAQSLEQCGTPVPYLKHVAAEHQRIEALYRKKKGKEPRSYIPDWLTEEYIGKVERNWAKLAPKIGLETFARNSGKRINAAIDLKEGSFVIELCNVHQKQVFEKMVGRGKGEPNYAMFREEILARLESDSVTDHQVRVEHELTAEQAKSYRSFLEKPRFTKADFAVLDKFYANGYDQLSELGKARMSRRVWDGTRRQTSDPRKEDAAAFLKAKAELKAIESELQTSFRWLENHLTEKGASISKAWLESLLNAVGEAAHSEIEISVVEWVANG